MRCARSLRPPRQAVSAHTRAEAAASAAALPACILREHVVVKHLREAAALNGPHLASCALHWLRGLPTAGLSGWWVANPQHYSLQLQMRSALSPAPALICPIYLQAPIQWDVQHIGKEVDPRTNSFVTRENLDSVLVRTRPLPLALGSVHCATSCWNGRGCTRLARAACS